MNNYRILIADEHAIVRIGLRMMIADLDSNILVEEANNGNTAVAMLKSGDFDLIILDFNMPGTEVFSLSAYIIKEFSPIRIMIFTMCYELSFAIRFLKMGIHGYLFKNAGVAEIQRAVGKIMHGEVYIGDWLSQALLEKRIASRVNNPFDKLSDRELEVALQIVRGIPTVQIAATLHLTRSTIGTHKSRILKKLNVLNTIELVSLARGCGLI